jgi:hypothetical protein
LDVFLEGVIALRVHAGSPAHAVGVVERHTFACDGGGSLGHQVSRVLVVVLMRRNVGQGLYILPVGCARRREF